jgi:hypothetical protein
MRNAPGQTAEILVEKLASILSALAPVLEVLPHWQLCQRDQLMRTAITTGAARGACERVIAMKKVFIFATRPLQSFQVNSSLLFC